MDARILTRIKDNLTTEQIEQYIISLFEGLHQLQITIYGFIYKNKVGIYTIAAREELEKLNNPFLEDFDFTKYVNTTDDKIFWLVEYDNEKGPILKRYIKE